MKNLLTVLTLIISTTIFAQSPAIGSISGKIIDNTTKEELPYVSIVIKNTKNEVLTGGITDEKGKFEVKKIPLGENTIEIQFIGYKTDVRKLNFTRKNAKYNLQTIGLSEDAAQLDEVVVVAETSTVVQKIDRKVINVGKDLTSAGTTASELLNNVQSVSVDSQTGNISLRGNENVRVLVDGKPTNISAAQLLKQIPSTSIKEIELITNPSAKYNPEGMSGMINIVLHKNANQGFNGNMNLGLTRGENTRFNGSIDMNYKTGKVNFYTNYGYNGGKSDNNGYVDRTDNNSYQEFEFGSENKSHLLKFGADVYINDKNTFSAYTIQNQSDFLSSGTTKISDDGVLVNDTFNRQDVENKNETYNFNYKTEFAKKGHNLEFEANFSNSKSPEEARNGDAIDNMDTENNYTSIVSNTRKNNIYNIDYTNPISKNGKLELGLELRNNESKNNINTTQSSVEAVQGLSYTRDIYSAYATYGHKFDKVTIQTGARFEQYEIDATFNNGPETQKVTDEIFSIYPSAFITYSPSDKNQWQVSYSRRVDRPSLQQINPIREWSTPRITSVGNPNLRPQFTNSFELNYTRQIKKGSLSLGTFYRRVQDNITRASSIDPLDEDKVLLTYDNRDDSDRYGFETSFNYALTKWWRVNASADVYTQSESGTANGEELEVRNNAFNARISNSFRATKNLRFQLFAMYRAGGRSIQFEQGSMSMVNIGSSLNVLKGKGTINFRVSDIFNGMRFKFEATNPYPSTGQFNWESRTAYLGFSYRFGGGKNRALKRKNRDNNETQGSGGFM